MRAKINYKSERTIIIVVIVLVLLIAAVISTVAFIKGNKNAAAAMTENDNDSTSISADNDNNNGNGNGEDGNANNGDQDLPAVVENDGNTGDVNDNTPDNGTTDNGTTTTANNAGTTGTTTGTTNPTVPNQEYVQETVIQGDDVTVATSTNVAWNAIPVVARANTGLLSINTPNLVSTKTAKVEGDTLYTGGKITYTITVENKGNVSAKNVNISDTIPEGTVLLDDNGNEVKDVTRIREERDIDAGETVTLTFTVKVTATEGLIENSAIVNGKNTNTETTEIKHKYKVEHYLEKLDGEYTLADTDLVDNVSTGDSTSYTAKSYYGYAFDDTLTVNKDAKVPENDELVIELYYVIDENNTKNLSYTVEYYKDGNIVSGDTQTVSTTVQVLQPDTLTVDKTQINTVDKYYGYRLEKTEPTTIPDTVNNGDVIKVYYVKGNYEYKVQYYYNGKLVDSQTETYTVPFETEVYTFTKKPVYNGVTYKQYDVKTSSSNKELPLIIGTGTNFINVYYGTTDVNITKSAPTTANIGETIHYTITVTNKGYIDATGVNVTDTLSERLDRTQITNITLNGSLSEDKTKIEWKNITVPATTGEVTLEFDAKVKECSIGKTIYNTATLGGTETGNSNTTETKVNELKASVKEVKKGETGKDSVNIVLVMDLSYSMEEYKVSDNSTTRLAAAKSAAKQFINKLYQDHPDSKATVTVLTFNTKNPITRTTVSYVGTKVCDKWHMHWDCKQIDGVWYSEWDTIEETETVPYSGTSQLGFADNTNYTELVNKINAIKLPSSNPTYSDGWSANGMGTNVAAALDLTQQTVTALETSHAENNNVVIFLSDGKPTESYDGNDTDSLTKKAGNIKGNPVTTEFYSIGFGSEAANKNSDAYKLLKKMSSNNDVSTSDSISDLVANFINILDKIEDKDPTPTVNGVYSIVTTKPLVVDNENPITVTYKGETLFTCTQLPKNGMSYDSETNTLTWDINAWNSVESNTKVTTSDIVIEYYIEK